MATTVHIPLREIELALDHARAGESVVLDGADESFHLQKIRQPGCTRHFADIGAVHIERTDMRPLSEILTDPAKKWSNIAMDEQWGRDMDQLMAENRAHDRDPWAE